MLGKKIVQLGPMCRFKVVKWRWLPISGFVPSNMNAILLSVWICWRGHRMNWSGRALIYSLGRQARRRLSIAVRPPDEINRRSEAAAVFPTI